MPYLWLLVYRGVPFWHQVVAGDCALALIGAWLVVRAAEVPLEPPRADLFDVDTGYRRPPGRVDRAPWAAFRIREVGRLAPGTAVSVLACLAGLVATTMSALSEDGACVVLGTASIAGAGFALWRAARRWEAVKSVLPAD